MYAAIEISSCWLFIWVAMEVRQLEVTLMAHRRMMNFEVQNFEVLQ